MIDLKLRIGLLGRIIIAIAFGILLGSIVPESQNWIVRTFVTFNTVFGQFLGFAIPLIILAFIIPGIGELGKGAGKLVGLTALIAYASTVVAGTLAYFATSNLFPQILSRSTVGAENPEEALLKGFMEFEIPPVFGVMTALILAFVIGIGIAAIESKRSLDLAMDFRDIIELLISKVIIPLLPIHIAGIFMNMTYAGQVAEILSVFSLVFVTIIILHLTMLMIQYSIAGGLNKENPFKLLKTMMPAYFTAIGTQSSAATIPVTLRQAKLNNTDEGVANFVIPLSATIHLSGSTITLTSVGVALMYLNGMPMSYAIVLPFILALGVTMIAAPGVPGGAVMASLGLFGSILGFDATMQSLVIALYLAQDSFGTATNVTGDGAIAKIIHYFKHNTKLLDNTASKQEDIA
ncbi:MULTISPECIES: dicarboxylate/amino acid:cation symporter [unclassified Exiguobacterium]|uniref:dicarboxylate/amino acid:cation symporter n=1 Tax=unclassified Exiguobacterium TaxID=2644629 RepID=UPI001BE8EB89|nr:MULTISPECIES: dicarboxylate/amino acid:cation symporter [unclassified Exiguobacterium]